MDLLKATKQALDMRLDIYFSLTLNQQREFNDNYQWQTIEYVLTEDFKKITSSIKLTDKLIALKDLTNKILVERIT